MDIIPFDQRDGYIWYNGEFVNWKDAKVHVLNHGLHYASCVFEGERIYNRKVVNYNILTILYFNVNIFCINN